MDWVINDTDQLTAALDSSEGECSILLATRGPNAEHSAMRLANVAADLCRELDVHTLFWNGEPHPIAASDFVGVEGSSTSQPARGRRVVPRRVRVSAAKRRAQFAREAKLGNWVMAATRAHMMEVTPEELESLELESRRAKTVPMRLSAWAMSISTALISAPLAIPLFVHNLLRGEDVKAAAFALGVATLYFALALAGIAPGLSDLL